MAVAETVIVCSLPLAKNAMHSPTSITLFRRSMFAPASSSSETTSVLPHLVAIISAESPFCVSVVTHYDFITHKMKSTKVQTLGELRMPDTAN